MEEFQPPAASADVSDIRRAKEAVGDDGVVAPWIQGAFNLVAFYYRKVDDLLMDALLRPSFYVRLLTYCLGHYRPQSCLRVAWPADVAFVTGAVC